MPFHDLPAKLVIVVASLLAHHVLEVRCASVGVVPNATVQAPASAPAPPNPSAPQTMERPTSPENDLLDPSKVPFLAICTNKQICDLYRNLTTGLNQKVDVDLNKIIVDKADGKGLCDNLSPLLNEISRVSPDRFEQSFLGRVTYCEHFCVDVNFTTMESHVKPICQVLMWAAQKEVDLEKDPTEKPMAKQDGGVTYEGQITGKSDAAAKPATSPPPVAAAAAAPVQPIITAPDATIKASGSKKSETAKKQSSAAASVSGTAPAVSEDVSSVSHTAAARIPTKPLVTPNDDNQDGKLETQEDINEVKNEENLNGLGSNNVGTDGTDLENNDEEGDELNYGDNPDIRVEEQASKNQKETTDNARVQSSFDGEQLDRVRGQDTVSIVQVERVDPFFEQDDSNFFSYFLFMMFVSILCYVVYHNKSKLLALALEGRRSSSGRGGFSKGRKHTAAYRKLDSNLEEAITSNTATGSRSTNQIIY